MLATGGKVRKLPFGENLVHYYRTLEDFRRIKNISEEKETFGVIGSGFIGSEIAAALAMNEKKVMFFDIGPRIGWTIFPPIMVRFLNDYFREKNVDTSLKYIDPSYMIRSLPANANDHVFCSFLGRDAVHAGMAGKTDVLIGYWNYTYVHLPMGLSAGKRKQVEPHGKLWNSVMEATGQGRLKNDQE